MQRKWWHEKTAYQIYPKSFCDTNGDGIGDLRGIIQKLDYLRELGIGIVWLSPVYRSPLADQGYDISDYYSIDPRFGTMDDMDELIREAKRRGIGVVMDLVVNHCSDEHEWFQKACQDPDGKCGQYFYIRKRGKNGELPCNWRSYFGGPVWSELPGHPDRVYLHLFHRKQPDLNWENPEVRREIYAMINWWLDKGLAGFRIDAIINIKKALPFRNYPADRDDGLSSVDNMLFEAKGVMDFLNEMADNTFRKYDAFTVGEVFNEKPEELPLFIGDNGCFSTMFDFAETVLNQGPEGWHAQKPITAEQYKRACFASQRKTRETGFLCNIIENHDEPRGVSRYLPEGACAGPYGLAAKKALGGLNFMLRGLPFLYQGQEIGMENTRCDSIEEVDDISARNEYKVALERGLSPEQAMEVVNRFSRDNARTPFQWDATPNAGFTSGTPWLKVNPNYREINLAAQREDPDSVWNFYRALTALRSNPAYRETVVYGETRPYMPNRKNLMAYFRRGEKQTLLVMGNYQGKRQRVRLPGKVKRVLLNNLNEFDAKDGVFKMRPWQFVVLEMTL
ncbi:MAG: alpha-glucosidase [Oscillospiraceae bacterium]|nr:alpha-glucosidase [Oscillospiraceae bacterium]